MVRQADAAASSVSPAPKLVLPLGRGFHGKSWWIRWAAERAQGQGRQVVLADADRTNPTLAAYFSNVLSPPSADERDVRQWLEALVEGQIESRSTVILDLGGGDQTLKSIAREIGLVNFLGQQGIEPVAVHLLGPDPDDLAYLRDVEIDQVFAPPATLIVLNEGLVPPHRTPAAAFKQAIEESSIVLETIKRGARVVRMPRLEPAAEIDLRRLTFEAAEAGQTGSGRTPMGPWKRQQVAVWRRSMEQAFSGVEAWLP